MSAVLPKEVYATLAGNVDGQMVQRVFAAFAQAINGGVKKVHLLIQSSGGAVADGVAIYNYLRGLPMGLVTYNGGTVSSIAVTIFLAARVRKASKTANFIIHRSQLAPVAATANQLQVAAKGLLEEDRRTEAILREHLNLSARQWKAHERGNLTIPADEALQVGLIHEIADFYLPQGNQIFNI